MRATELTKATLEEIKRAGGRDWTELYESGRKPTVEENDRLWDEYYKSDFAKILYAMYKNEDPEANEKYKTFKRRCGVYMSILERGVIRA